MEWVVWWKKEFQNSYSFRDSMEFVCRRTWAEDAAKEVRSQTRVSNLQKTYILYIYTHLFLLGLFSAGDFCLPDDEKIWLSCGILFEVLALLLCGALLCFALLKLVCQCFNAMKLKGGECNRISHRPVCNSSSSSPPLVDFVARVSLLCYRIMLYGFTA